MTPSVIRVRPDVAAIARSFDYAVPDKLAQADWRVGSRVRIALAGRRVGGWVTELDPDSPEGVDLVPVAKWSGHGPSAEVIDLCEWTARRWFGAVPKLLGTASPPRNVYRLGRAQVVRHDGPVAPSATALFQGAGATAVVAPGTDRWPIVLAGAALGNPLILVPTVRAARQVADRLRRSGLVVALMPDDWGRAAGGAIVVGTRAAVLAPTAELGAIVMFDEHDDAWREERTPTWHAREVALERARRTGCPCVLVSPAPSVRAVGALRVASADRRTEHAGWPAVHVIDRRDEMPGRLGLFSEPLVRELRSEGRVACVLNRLGRVRLLGCTACGQVASCDVCEAAVRQTGSAELACERCGTVRPVLCASCGSSRLKNLVLGVGRAREELAALLGEAVGEVTAGEASDADSRVVIGTEALLREPPRPGRRFSTVAFLDFDQHLTAPRQRAEAEAMALLVLAARQVGPRAGGGRVLVQTRAPEHRVLLAAVRADAMALTDELAAQAQAMGWPPAVAQAQVSGSGAAEFMARLANPVGLTVLGPNDDAWLIRSPDRELLLAELAAVDPPDSRTRVALD